LAHLLKRVLAGRLVPSGLELAGLLDGKRGPARVLLEALHQALARRGGLCLGARRKLLLLRLLLLLLLRRLRLRHCGRDDGGRPEQGRREQYLHCLISYRKDVGSSP